MKGTKQVVVAAQHSSLKRCQVLRRSPVVVHVISQQPVVTWSHTLTKALMPANDPPKAVQSAAEPAAFRNGL